MTNEISSVSSWIECLGLSPIPVLKQTARELLKLKEDENQLTVRNITPIVLHDPLMSFKVISYAKKHPSRHQQQDLIQVEQAVLMMGTNAFYSNVPADLLIEEQLKNNLPAMGHLLKLIKRTHRACHFATEMAAFRKDLRSDEVLIATLLHDLAEMLMWCFAPDKMLTIVSKQKADKTLRSKAVQEEVLGFKLSDLQKGLVETFQLPPLLSELMDDEHVTDQRAINVHLAVNLARHSANGWDDAALPDDYKDIAQFLRVDIDKAKQVVGVPSETFF